MRYEAVVFDFYGTLAESDGAGLRVADLLTEHGYELTPDIARRYWQDGLDGSSTTSTRNLAITTSSGRGSGFRTCSASAASTRSTPT